MRGDLACETHARIHLETFQCFTLNTEDCSDVPGVGVVLSRATQRKSPSCSFRTSNCTPEKEIKNKAGPYKKLIIFSTPMYTTLTQKKVFPFFILPNPFVRSNQANKISQTDSVLRDEDSLGLIGPLLTQLASHYYSLTELLISITDSRRYAYPSPVRCYQDTWKVFKIPQQCN